MRASKIWHCQCGCTETIQPGQQMIIIAGMIYRPEHTTRDCFEDAGLLPPPREIVLQRPKIVQQPLEDLPLFSRDIKTVQQSLKF